MSKDEWEKGYDPQPWMSEETKQNLIIGGTIAFVVLVLVTGVAGSITWYFVERSRVERAAIEAGYVQEPVHGGYVGQTIWVKPKD
jgi:hypothetical protein